MQLSGLINQREGIALVDRRDLDRGFAMSLAEAKYKAVINRAQSLSGAYPAEGARYLIEHGVPVLDNVGDARQAALAEGDFITIKDDWVYHDNHKVAHGQLLDLASLERVYASALEQVAAGFEKFVSGTAVYLRKSDSNLLFNPQVADLGDQLKQRQALVVADDPGITDDLRALRAYVGEVKPFVICEAEAEVRLKQMKISPDLVLGPGQNADYGLVLAYQNDATLIVSVGMRSGLADFMAKPQELAAEQLLTRIKVGDRLIDARGVSMLYHAAPSMKLAFPVLAVGLLIIIVLFCLIPNLRDFWQLAWLNLRAALGF